MEFMQMEMFVAVAEERSMRKAAERVLRTPPAVSMAIKKLEEEVGLELFERRSGSECLLTGAGQIMYRHARRLLADRRMALSALDTFRVLEERDDAKAKFKAARAQLPQHAALRA